MGLPTSDSNSNNDDDDDDEDDDDDDDDYDDDDEYDEYDDDGEDDGDADEMMMMMMMMTTTGKCLMLVLPLKNMAPRPASHPLLQTGGMKMAAPSTSNNPAFVICWIEKFIVDKLKNLSSTNIIIR